MHDFNAKKNAAPLPAVSLGVGQTGFRRDLEDQLRAKLEDTWIVGTRDLQLIAGAIVVAEAAILAGASKLGVVPGVETLGPELKPGAARFADDEALKERQVPVIAPRSSDVVEPGVPPGSGRRVGKG